jgi:hypothetical protein
MDSRLDVEKVLGLDLGDAHVIRNGTCSNFLVSPAKLTVTAGGRAVEALRSILISQQMLGTREIIVMHHVRPSNFTSFDFIHSHGNIIRPYFSAAPMEIVTGPADTPRF